MNKTLVDLTPLSPNVETNLRPDGSLSLAQGLNAISLSPSQVEALKSLLSPPADRPIVAGDRVVLNMQAPINDDGMYRCGLKPNTVYTVTGFNKEAPGEIFLQGHATSWYISRFVCTPLE